MIKKIIQNIKTIPRHWDKYQDIKTNTETSRQIPRHQDHFCNIKTISGNQENQENKICGHPEIYHSLKIHTHTEYLNISNSNIPHTVISG